MIPAPLRGFRAAIVFLTRLPAGGYPYRDQDQAWSLAWFPVVGALVGAVAAGAWLLAEPLGPWPSALVALVTSVLVTGAFHEDGLADSADALGGGIEDRARVLAILKDSRLGTYGTSALVLSFLLRASLLVELGPEHAWALVLVHGLARTPPTWVKVHTPYATGDASARSRNLQLGRPVHAAFAIAAGLALAAGMASEPMELAWLVLVLVTVTVIVVRYTRRRVGGHTGDFLGALEQLGELAVLMVLVGVRS